MSLDKLKTLNAIQQRRAAALLGALVSDAAMAPLHWIYDQNKVAELIKDKEHGGVFYPTSQCPYYRVPTGSNSAYGEQLYVTLKCIAENKGFDPKQLSDAIFRHFGPGTIFEDARNQTSNPVQGPWTNHSLKIMIANREEGSTPEGDVGSQDPDGLCKCIAIVSLLSGSPDLMSVVKECVNTAQLHEVAVNYAKFGSALLDHVIQTGEDGFEKLLLSNSNLVDSDSVQKAIKNEQSHVEAVKGYGLACKMPPSFFGMVHGIAHATGYVDAVCKELVASGDNCSRGTFVGAYTAAKFGLDSIPSCYLKNYSRSEEVLGYIETVVQL